MAYTQWLNSTASRCEVFSDDFRHIHGLPVGVRFGGDPHDGPGLDRRERGVDLVHERREVLAGVALRAQRHDCEVEAGEVLLNRRDGPSKNQTRYCRTDLAHFHLTALREVRIVSVLCP
jgi:hypothetical protein